MEQIGQEGPMVHIGAAIASSLTWMHGRFPTHRKDGSRRYASPYLQTISKFTQKAWPFVSYVSQLDSDYLLLVHLRMVFD